MTERQRALTLPLSVDKDKMMENPLRIPMTCLSADCGRLERQVPWTAIAGCKLRHCDSQHKNASMLFEHNHAAMVECGIAGRKPRLILTDVLKTELGKAYIERIKQNHSPGKRGQVTSTQKESGGCREESLIRRGTRSTQREARNDKNKSTTPKGNQKTTPSSAQRSKLRRRLHNADGDDESKDIDEVIISKDNGEDYKFAEVVDCGLSVSWEPAEDTGSCDEFSPANIKDRWTDTENEVQQSLKRKRKDAGTHCNGTGSPKRHRESVLRLTGEDGRDGGPAQTHICFEESGEDLDLESLDRSIVQFTVGADERTDVLLPIINPNLEAGDFIGTPNCRVSSSQDDATKTSPSEPIVLSSDDEDSSGVPQPSSPAVHTLVTVEGTVIRGQSSQEATAKRKEAPDTQEVLHVVLKDLPGSVPVTPMPTVDHSCMGVAFSRLHCGGYQGKANGDIMITDQKIIIPLKDINEQVEVMLSLEREELRRYSVWEQEELEDQGIHCMDDEDPPPAAVLLFCVSETAAAAIQWDLRKLKQDGTTNTGKASPFILLTLRDPLKGMEGALLRSFLDIDCLKSFGHDKSFVDGVGDLEDIHCPVLSLDDSLELIKRTGLDPHLLSLLGVESTDPDPDPDPEPEPVTDQESPYSDRDSNVSPHIELEDDSQKETALELETPQEQDTEMQLKPDEDQIEQELKHSSEKSREKKPIPAYTLCHRRTRGSYSVSLCKADSSWTKYKHQGLARRLIQFPPPPLKGGITVTMEDLQCLDSGQFLNDVIIDFYLKYLLQNASDSVAERSHIFSSFFYKQLTRRDNASEGVTSDSCQRQRRHQRVKTWTRHVDIFKKDFLFVPVNQEAHWYLVVICFPGLEEPKVEPWTGPNSMGNGHNGTEELQDQEEAQGTKSSNDSTETPPTLNHSDNTENGTKNENAQEDSTKESPSGPVNCTEQTCQRKSVCKRPCILIMDSLRLSLHERVFKLLREYLQSEWEVRRGSSREFGPDQMKSSHCQVPLQDNSSDCGLYLLQYVESFLKDPVVHFDLPLHLGHWFPRQQVRRKRDEIRDLVLNLYRHQNLDDNR